MRFWWCCTMIWLGCGAGAGPTEDTLASDSASEDANDVDQPEVDESSPVIVVVEGDEVEVQTTVRLAAAWGARDAVGDPVVSWRWTLTQPDGSVSLLRPSADIAEPRFEANVVGHYEIGVTLTTASGQSAHVVLAMSVITSSALHVELLWHTPGDIDESDEGMTLGGAPRGSDVDLHLLARPDALWFDQDDDCYFSNKDPDWQQPDWTRAPHLDRDDTDGAGPENINVTVLDESACYRIGVHYWDDWGYGASIAAVRVYLGGALIHEVSTRLVHHDLWDVGVVCADGTFTPTGGCESEPCVPVVTPNYPIPL